MSLGDLSKKVNISGQHTYASAHERILKEKLERDRQLQAVVADRAKHDLLKQKTEKSKVQREIDRVRRDLVRLKTSVQSQDAVKRAESQLRALEGQMRLIDQNINSKNSQISRDSLHF